MLRWNGLAEGLTENAYLLSVRGGKVLSSRRRRPPSHAERRSVIVITDPPYYDNIHYADSSDFFYVWLRPLLRDIYPDLFASMMTPKDRKRLLQTGFGLTNHNSHFEKRCLRKALSTNT